MGTPEYIAPEVLTSLDHTAAEYGVCCDWWSLGIIAYELIYDVMPFTGGSTAETYSNIMNYEVTVYTCACAFNLDTLEVKLCSINKQCNGTSKCLD